MPPLFRWLKQSPCCKWAWTPYNQQRMKDKSLIWLVAGAIALWLFFAYPPAREEVIRIGRSIWNWIEALF